MGKDQVDLSGYHLIVAFDVNARGEIVVCAVQLNSGNVHAALLTPQPANASGDTGESAAEATAVPSWIRSMRT